jgi:hypothetical protein
MPCYQVRKTTVDAQTMKPDILAEALKQAGFDASQDGAGRVVFTKKGSYQYHWWEAGQLKISGSNAAEMVNEVKRAYSAQVVRSAAQQFGWKASEKQQGQFEVTKRR